MQGALRQLGAVIGHVYALYYRTLRLEALLSDGSTLDPNDYPFDRQIFVFSERDALALAGITAQRRFTVLVANGRDGDLAAAALTAMGCRVIRGSTRRGGARALRRLLAVLEADRTPAGLVVDGPLGPVNRAQPGAAFCALQTDRPVFVLAAACSRAIVFRGTWSRLYLPIPFSRVVLSCDGPLPARGSATRDAVSALTAAIGARLDIGRRRAMAHLTGSRSAATQVADASARR
jgi:lysophospholipid acyltransferase (LPLAT)-like uncharacterized protein